MGSGTSKQLVGVQNGWWMAKTGGGASKQVVGGQSGWWWVLGQLRTT